MAGTIDGCGPVLVADDDPGLLGLVELSLQEAGYGTVTAASGHDAVGLATTTAICAAVLDVNLPGRSAYEVCREFRRLFGRALPIVFVSGERMEAYDRIAGLMLGADDYLVKPFDPRELVLRIDGLLRRTRPALGQRPLTPRELEVITLLAEGLDQGQIAERLNITSKTVATHIDRILGKLGVRSRAQAVAIAYRDALVVV